MSNTDGFTKKHQDTYFRDGRCPFCGSDDLRLGMWEEVELQTRERDVYCDQCDEEWREVHYRDVGQRFLEYEGSGLEALIAEEERQAKKKAQEKAVHRACEKYRHDTGFFPGRK